jgi:CHC2 zinc finger
MYDLEEIHRKVSLIDLAEKAGARFQSSNRLSSCCPLPRHAGDRSNPTAFHIYQDGRRWKCFSSCPDGAKGGDVIDFYMAWKEVDFKVAIKELAELAEVVPDPDRVSRASSSRQLPIKPVPTGPTLAWQARASQFIAWAQQNLRNSDGLSARDYLERERGLWPETWLHFRLGYNPRNLSDDPVNWGLGGKRIWLPRGIVIPGIWKERPWYVKIRRPRVDDLLGQYIGAWREQDGLPEVKFSGPRGGQLALFSLEKKCASPVLMLVEGEWDAMLTWQWCLDLCDVSTLGGAQAHLDVSDLITLSRYLAVTVVHDDDSAGDRGREYIAKIRDFTQRIMVVDPPAHDLTDFWKNGGNLRAWVAGYVADALEDALVQVDHCLHNPTVEHWRRVSAWAKHETCFYGHDHLPHGS